jgi:hypothetical protein
VRLYLPATLLDLDRTGDLGPAVAHAVTPELRELFPDEDDEGLEFAAQLAAADGSFELLRSAPDAPRLRAVLALDVPDDLVGPADDDDLAVSAVRLTGAVDRDAVACAHVDEPGAAADVEAALAGDEAASERLDERDLLWYDASELAGVPRT